MRTVSHHILSLLPAALALVIVLLSASPLDAAAVSYTPNTAWLMTLVMVAFYPPAWPRSLAFFLGLLQDILFATPLGSQALLALLLAQVTGIHTSRQHTPPFRVHWLEAAGALLVWHLLLWMIIHLVAKDGASLNGLLRAGLINALWYPLFYWLLTRLFSALRTD